MSMITNIRTFVTQVGLSNFPDGEKGLSEAKLIRPDGTIIPWTHFMSERSDKIKTMSWRDVYTAEYSGVRRIDPMRPEIGSVKVKGLIHFTGDAPHGPPGLPSLVENDSDTNELRIEHWTFGGVLHRFNGPAYFKIGEIPRWYIAGTMLPDIEEFRDRIGEYIKLHPKLLKQTLSLAETNGWLTADQIKNIRMLNSMIYEQN